MHNEDKTFSGSSDFMTSRAHTLLMEKNTHCTTKDYSLLKYSGIRIRNRISGTVDSWWHPTGTRSRYLHIPLDKKSSFPTTFNTPWGKNPWLRLPLRLNIARDVVKCPQQRWNHWWYAFMATRKLPVTLQSPPLWRQRELPIALSILKNLF